MSDSPNTVEVYKPLNWMQEHASNSKLDLRFFCLLLQDAK